MQSDVAEVVARFCSEIERSYVFPDVAALVVEHVRIRHATYPALVESADLADSLTRAAFEISGDRHLGVRVWPISNDTPSDSEEFAAERRRRAIRSNYGVAKVARLAGNVGLFELTNFFEAHLAAEVLAAAMRVLVGTEALIIDLRRNRGGWPETVAFLETYFVDADSDPVHLNDFYLRQRDLTQQYWSLSYVPGPRFASNKSVFVLVGAETFSGAEAFAYELQALKRAVIVGEVSGGGAHPGERIRLDRHLAAFIPYGRAINPVTGGNWEGVGVVPDVPANGSDALAVAHRLALSEVIKRDDLDRELAAEVLAALEGLT